jgi:hypothetical protein
MALQQRPADALRGKCSQGRPNGPAMRSVLGLGAIVLCVLAVAAGLQAIALRADASDYKRSPVCATASADGCRALEPGVTLVLTSGKSANADVILPHGPPQTFAAAVLGDSYTSDTVAEFWKQKIVAVRSKDGAVLFSTPFNPAERYESARGTAAFLGGCALVLGLVWMALQRSVWSRT